MAEVMVLCYHGVSETWDAREAVTPDELERQLAYLVRQGWRAATFGHALQDPPAARTVAITFDDALISVKRLAFPILTRLGLTATVFAPTAYVSSGEQCTWDGLHRWAGTAHADELSPMSWATSASSPRARGRSARTLARIPISRSWTTPRFCASSRSRARPPSSVSAVRWRRSPTPTAPSTTAWRSSPGGPATRRALPSRAIFASWGATASRARGSTDAT